MSPWHRESSESVPLVQDTRNLACISPVYDEMGSRVCLAAQTRCRVILKVTRSCAKAERYGSLTFSVQSDLVSLFFLVVFVSINFYTIVFIDIVCDKFESCFCF